ncbi:MAG: S24/S26 family peptidase [Clostridia bacterium]|nr:S24/S26 family peptidase [Clostridia bacterium]
MNDKSTSSLRETLAEHDIAVVQGKGTSMMPLIANSRDRMCIKSLSRRPKKYDVLVYENPRGIVAHRALKCTDEHIVMCGDNQYVKETVPYEAVIGYVPGILRNGTDYLDFEKTKWCVAYSRIWCVSLFLRRCVLFVYHRISKRYKNESAYARANK